MKLLFENLLTTLELVHEIYRIKFVSDAPTPIVNIYYHIINLSKGRLNLSFCNDTIYGKVSFLLYLFLLVFHISYNILYVTTSLKIKF